ncbi:HflX-like GTP-binding protein [Micromonospora sp. NPDC003197]
MSIIRTVILVGLFSAKVRDYQDQLDALDAEVTTLGVQVRAHIVQRRGVSAGGVRLMASPLSRRFLIGPGKLEQVAAAAESLDVDAVVFVNELTAYQRRSLAARFARPVLSRADVARSTSALTVPPQSRRLRTTPMTMKPNHRSYPIGRGHDAAP